MLFQLKLHVVNLFELVKKPRVDRSHFGNLLDGVSLPKSVTHVGKPLGVRGYQTLCKNLRFDFLRTHSLTSIERANSLLQGLFEGATDGHYFADGFHLWSQRFVGTGKLFELPLRNLYNHVVKRGLETGGSLAGDVVWNFIERIANGKLRCDFCNRKAS